MYYVICIRKPFFFHAFISDHRNNERQVKGGRDRRRKLYDILYNA